MPFHNPLKRHSKKHESDNQVENANTDRRQTQEQLPPYHDVTDTNGQETTQDGLKRAPSATSKDKKEPRSSSQALSPTSSTSDQSQPPQYRRSKPEAFPDPFDPTGVPYGFQYEENGQNFAHPSSVRKDIGKDMKYDDPKAAALARRASETGRGDLTEMMNYFLRQQELGKKSIDNQILAWNGV